MASSKAGRPQPSPFTEDEERGIIRRLALFESPDSIAHGYGLQRDILRRFAEAHRVEVVGLRRSWREWLSTVEPLCNKSNRILFLGNLARWAAKEHMVSDAIKATCEIEKVLEKEEEAAVLDQAVLLQIQRGDYEMSGKLQNEFEMYELENLSRGHSKPGCFLEIPPQVTEIEEGAREVPDCKPPTDPAWKVITSKRRGEREEAEDDLPNDPLPKEAG